MKTTIEIDIPEGYEFVRFGYISSGESYLADDGLVYFWEHEFKPASKLIILKRKAKQTRRYKVALIRTPELEFTTTQDFNNNFNNVENNKYFVKWITKDWVEYEV